MPVINVDQMSFADIEKNVLELGTKAEMDKLLLMNYKEVLSQ